MRSPRSLIALCLAAATALLGCQDHEAELDQVIREYMELRVERDETSCKCYELFINVDEPGYPPFTSEQECIAVQGTTVDDSSHQCIKSVLESGVYDTKGSIEVMRCYNDDIRNHIACMEQHIDTCDEVSFVDCSVLGSDGTCKGDLTDDQVSTIKNCI